MASDDQVVQLRFEKIRAYFLDWMKHSGHARTELYYRPKPGDAREPTEEEVVRKWARETRLPMNDILIGIARAFEVAPDRGDIVTSFRYCEPQIVKRWNEVKDARVGS